MGDYKRCGCGKRSAHVDVCDTGVRFECCGTRDEGCCVAGLRPGWTTEPLPAAPAPTPGDDEPDLAFQHTSVIVPDPRDAEIERLRADRDGLVATLVRVFGWSDVSCLHAALHVENAVRNLQATLATEHAETERLRGLYGWLTDEVRKLAHEGDWGHGRTHEQLLSDVRRKIDGGAAEIAALRERNAELEAAVDDTLHHGGNALFPAGISGEPAAPAAVARTRDALARLAEARRGGTSALDALRAEDKARIAALEAALVSFEALVNDAAMKGVEAGSVWHPIVHVLGKRIRARLDEIGQTSALSAALAAERESGRSEGERLAQTACAAVHGDHAAILVRMKAAEAEVRTLRQAASLIASDIRVKHAHYEDAHLNPKPKRPIPVDEANWLRTLEHALAGDAEAIENTIEARAEIATEAALADQKTRVLDAVKAKVEGLAMTSADPVIGLAVNRYAVLAAIEAAREG